MKRTIVSKDGQNSVVTRGSYRTVTTKSSLESKVPSANHNLGLEEDTLLGLKSDEMIPAFRNTSFGHQTGASILPRRDATSMNKKIREVHTAILEQKERMLRRRKRHTCIVVLGAVTFAVALVLLFIYWSNFLVDSSNILENTTAPTSSTQSPTATFLNRTGVPTAIQTMSPTFSPIGVDRELPLTLEISSPIAEQVCKLMVGDGLLCVEGKDVVSCVNGIIESSCDGCDCSDVDEIVVSDQALASKMSTAEEQCKLGEVDPGQSGCHDETFRFLCKATGSIRLTLPCLAEGATCECFPEEDFDSVFCTGFSGCIVPGYSGYQDYEFYT